MSKTVLNSASSWFWGSFEWNEIKWQNMWNVDSKERERERKNTFIPLFFDVSVCVCVYSLLISRRCFFEYNLPVQNRLIVLSLYCFYYGRFNQKKHTHTHTQQREDPRREQRHSKAINYKWNVHLTGVLLTSSWQVHDILLSIFVYFVQVI